MSPVLRVSELVVLSIAGLACYFIAAPRERRARLARVLTCCYGFVMVVPGLVFVSRSCIGIEGKFAAGVLAPLLVWGLVRLSLWHVYCGHE